MNIITPDKILAKEYCERERTQKELIDWVEEKYRLFAQTPDSRNYARLCKGLSKEFFEEIRPLSLFVKHLYRDRIDVRCVPNVGNENFDALITDPSKNPPELKIEFTQAIDGYEDHLRMVYLIKDGHVNWPGTVTSTGTQNTGRTVEVKNEVVEHNEVVKKCLELITIAAKGKSERKYGKDTLLVIVFDDDTVFPTDKDLSKLDNHVRTELLPMRLDFAKLYLLGSSGNTLMEFPLGNG